MRLYYYVAHVVIYYYKTQYNLIVHHQEIYK